MVTLIQSKEDMIKNVSFLKEKGHIISLVGGGGKTTWMYALGLCGASLGMRVLLTTTTHTQKPPYMAGRWGTAVDSFRKNGKNVTQGTANKTKEPFMELLLKEQDRFVWARTAQEANRLQLQGYIPVLGAECQEKKLEMPQKAVLYEAIQTADLVIIEADGAKGLPCKIPGQNEPVLLEESDIVLGVAGISAVGGNMADVCFRYHGDSYRKMTVRYLAHLISSENGAKKSVGNRVYYAVLNQCDNEDRMDKASEVAKLLQENGTSNIFLSAFT